MRPDNYLTSDKMAPMRPIATDEQPRGLSLLNAVKALLFDVYGTLIISRAGERSVFADHGQTESIHHLLQGFSITDSSQKVARLLRSTISREHGRLKAQGIAYPEVDILEIWQAILGWDDLPRLQTFARKYECIINPVYPMPGVRDLLRSCRDRGLCIGIISNAQFYTQGLLEEILASSLAAWGFDSQLIFYSYQYQTAKPSVRLFEMAAERLLDRGIQPAESLYVGNDMRNDVLPSQKVGFKTALFAGDKRSLRWRKQDPDCRGLVPDMVVTDLRQLVLDKEGFEGSW